MSGDGPHEQQGLERCPDCRLSFVVPVALLDLVDEGLYLIALHCKNCDRLAVGVHEDAELERVELFNERAAAEIDSALEELAVSRFVDDLTAFSEALGRDAVLPEDF